MSKAPVLACFNWKDNSYLIEHVAKLGYLKRNVLTLDPTYGRGIWWKRFRPINLFDHDLEADGHDFRNLPYADETFGQIAYDPPYVSMGGRKTTGIRKFYEAYGLTGAPTSPAKLQTLINDGLTEMYRLCEMGGIVLVKCCDYISSGKFHNGTYLTQQHAMSLGFVVVDRFIMWGAPRMQPKRKRKDGKKSRQKHARNNCSMLYVLRKVS